MRSSSTEKERSATQNSFHYLNVTCVFTLNLSNFTLFFTKKLVGCRINSFNFGCRFRCGSSSICCSFSYCISRRSRRSESSPSKGLLVPVFLLSDKEVVVIVAEKVAFIFGRGISRVRSFMSN